MRPVISICAIAFVIVITCCSSADAHPFINLFNVAIKTDFTEDGNIVSFVYPKNKYQVSVKFNSETVNEHSFNLGGLIKSITRHFSKRIGSLNPFKFFAPTTTTEAPLDLSDDEHEGDSVSSNGGYSYSSNNGVLDDDVKDKESELNDTIEAAKDDEVSKGDTNGGVLSNGYEYPDQGTLVTIESAAVSYLPPSTPRSLYLPAN
ncbi:hypothetical protein PVAND_013689 [Polypedilum vanderplanki]|uniref:Uncharacterized protein n=1 Tax=Polypedilum vanderplanki TaxID=319348 RepID=A0A9J6CRH1_POLVA|nr:hypothetical protein PVAND_013689 [Polypedilum vanderplanki]